MSAFIEPTDSLSPLGGKGCSLIVAVRHRCLGSCCMPRQIATPPLSTDGRGQAHCFCPYRGALDRGSLDIDQSFSWSWLCDNDSDAIRGPQRTNLSSMQAQATMWRPVKCSCDCVMRSLAISWYLTNC